MQELTISKDELAVINKVLLDVLQKFPGLYSAGNCHENAKISLHSYSLPERLLEFLLDFKYDESGPGVCLIRGFDVDNDKIRPTPSHWRSSGADEATKEESLFLFLCSAVLGDPIGWTTQQDGNVIHNIVPIKGDEHKQVGSSALTTLWWHTEEAFHPYRCDYLGLLCLRNDEGAATSYASVGDLELSARDKRSLFLPHYSIYPDSAHLAEVERQELNKGKEVKMIEAPDKIAILFGDQISPYLCIDPYYMNNNGLSAESSEAFQKIVSEIDRNLHRVVLEPGDLLLVDNYRAVHGREPFVAKYDGTGRWLKRANVVRDIRKSRSMRDSSQSSIIKIC